MAAVESLYAHGFFNRIQGAACLVDQNKIGEQRTHQLTVLAAQAHIVIALAFAGIR